MSVLAHRVGHVSRTTEASASASLSDATVDEASSMDAGL